MGSDPAEQEYAGRLAKREQAEQKQIDFDGIVQGLQSGEVELTPQKILQIAQYSPELAKIAIDISASKQAALQPVTLRNGNIVGYDKYTNTMTPANMAGQAAPSMGGDIEISDLPSAQGGNGNGNLSAGAAYEQELANVKANAPLTRQQIIENERRERTVKTQEEAAELTKATAEKKANILQQERDAAMFGGQNSVIDAIGGVNELLTNKGFNSAVGSKVGSAAYAFGLKDEPFAGTDASGFLAREKELQGKAFLETRQLLKGGGAITDFESKKAESSLLRANNATSEQEYIEAMTAYKAALVTGYNKLRTSQGHEPISEADLLGAGGEKSTSNGGTSLPNGWAVREK
jgi:hypothetical protein